MGMKVAFINKMLQIDTYTQQITERPAGTMNARILWRRGENVVALCCRFEGLRFGGLFFVCYSDADAVAAGRALAMAAQSSRVASSARSVIRCA